MKSAPGAAAGTLADDFSGHQFIPRQLQGPLLWRAQEPAAATGCPIDFEQAAEFQFLHRAERNKAKPAEKTEV